jgi:hypothetical protein
MQIFDQRWLCHGGYEGRSCGGGGERNGVIVL